MNIKKKYLIFGFIIVLILIIGINSGCIHNPPKDESDSSSNVSYVTINELNLHPNRYLGENLTAKAIFEGKNDNDRKIFYHVICDVPMGYNTEWVGIEIPDNVDSSLLMLGEEYYFIGIPGYGNYTAYDDEEGEPLSGLYIRIKSIDLVHKDNSDNPTLKQISDHPPRYLNRTITVKATIENSLNKITDKEKIGRYTYTISINVNTTNADISMLIPGGEYYFTGFLQLEGLHPYIPSYVYPYWDYQYNRDIKEITFVIEKIEPT